MIKFHPLEVTSVSHVADNAVSIALDVPRELEAAFAFHAGQYVTVRRHLGSRDQRRTYSIVSTPGDLGLKLGVRVHDHGLMSGFLATEVRPGDLLDVGTPTGRFGVDIDPQRQRTYVAFAAGSGITPVLSIAAAVLAGEPHSALTLLYGNRSIARTMFVEETLALKNRYMGRFSVHFIMSREQQHAAWLNGRIDANKVRELARFVHELATADEYLICGPGDMVDEVRGAVTGLNPASPIRLERFSTGNKTPIEVPSRPVAAVPLTDVLAVISVTMDGRNRTFPMSHNDLSVLDAAERAGIDLPFSCRSGICATCRTRVITGTTVMAHNIGLERWEVDAGFVLCCQARPTSSTLAISYDEK